MDEILTTILEWYKKQSAPNNSRAYNKCPVCGSTWWTGADMPVRREPHNFGCWVPELQDATLPR